MHNEPLAIEQLKALPKDARMRQCSFENCDKKHFGKGYCNTHYIRYLKHGNPAITLRQKGRLTPTKAGYLVKRINGSQRLLHRFIMEQYIQRKLFFNECVHHLNGDKTDNQIENLKIMFRDEHTRLHQAIIGKCHIENCEKNLHAKGYCLKHYKLQWNKAHKQKEQHV